MEITVQNYVNKKWKLDNKSFPVINVKGLTPSGATINTSKVATMDGSIHNSSKVNDRNIVLTIVPQGNAEKSRTILYQYFKPKYPVRLYFKTKNRDVYIDGCVESFEGSLYEQCQAFQISIICPRPYFSACTSEIIEQSRRTKMFYFPLLTVDPGISLGRIKSNADVNVMNAGEEDTGIVIRLTAHDTVLTPTIYNKTTRDTFTIQIQMAKGDVITIDTRKGRKKVRLNSNGHTTNVLNCITKNSRWFQLVSGVNVFAYSCASGGNNLQVEYEIINLYGGV